MGAMRAEPELNVVDPLAAGREALSRGEWEQALACFEAASEGNHSAEAIEALAMAAWWLDNAQLAIESREHAYRLYRERGETAAAARMAIWLGWDSLAFRGESAVARGELQRAHRLLEGLDPVPEHGWLALREGEFAFLLANDIAATRRFAEWARSKGGSGKRPSCSVRSSSTPTPSSGSRMSHSISGTRPLRRTARRDSCGRSARRAGSSARPDSTCTLARSSH
jgi:tetratricopeptide (TPR) repeat protein